MIDYTPFVIGALFGFGAGFMVAHYVHRIPQLTRARKAAKTRQINTVKRSVRSRVQNMTLLYTGHSYDSAIEYYQQFSPTLFEGLVSTDLDRIRTELAQEDTKE